MIIRTISFKRAALSKAGMFISFNATSLWFKSLNVKDNAIDRNSVVIDSIASAKTNLNSIPFHLNIISPITSYSLKGK